MFLVVFLVLNLCNIKVVLHFLLFLFDLFYHVSFFVCHDFFIFIFCFGDEKVPGISS